MPPNRARHVIVFRSIVLPGSETFIKEQCVHLQRWHPLLLGLSAAPRSLNLAGLAHAITRRPGPSLWQRLTGLWHRRQVLLPTEALALARAHRPDLVHAHFGPDGLVAHELAKALDVPLIVTLHGYDVFVRPDFWRSGAQGRFMRSYPEGLAILAAAPRVHFIAVSKAVRDQAVSVCRLPPEKVSVGHIGIDTQRFRATTMCPMAERPMTVTFVGRLVGKKGVHILIRAMARVVQDHPEARLCIVGDGPQRETLAGLAEEVGCPADFLGHLTPDQVTQQLNQTRLFCLPSITDDNGDAEGFGLVILEAQSCGVPAISSARGGATEGLLHGETGFRFPEGDVQALYEAITSVIHDTAKLDRMGQSARAFVESTFDIRRCTQALERLYDQMTECP